MYSLSKDMSTRQDTGGWDLMGSKLLVIIATGEREKALTGMSTHPSGGDCIWIMSD